MAQFFLILSLIASAVGGLTLLTGLGSVSAPQQAAIAAMGIGFAVVPYVFARSIQLVAHHKEQAATLQEIRSILQDIKEKQVEREPTKPYNSPK